MGKFIYFTINELCNSNKKNGIEVKFKPNDIQKQNLRDLIINLLDPACAILGSPIVIKEGFSDITNGNLAGLDYSGGNAVKGTCNEPTYLYSIIKQLNDFDELFLIDENGKESVFLSFRKGENRKRLGIIKDYTFTWKNF